MPALVASMSHTYTLYLAVSEDPTKLKTERFGIFAGILECPSGSRRFIVCNIDDPVRLCEKQDCHYAAIILCVRAKLLPVGAHLCVVSKQQHYHGGNDYVGPLNVSRKDRRANGYTNKDGKTPIKKWEHLGLMDDLLHSMDITTSGRMPQGLLDRSAIEQCREEATTIMKRLDMLRDGVTPPEAY